MKIVFKQSVGDKIIQAKTEALMARREIDYVELTQSEFDALCWEVRSISCLAWPIDVQSFHGVKIKVVK